MNPLQRIKRQNKKRRQSHSAWTLNELESRLMLAGDAGVAVAGSAAQPAAIVGEAQVSSACNQHASEIVFLDARVDDLQQVVDGVSPDAELILLDSERGGLEQMSQILATRSNVQSVHVIAHGTQGRIQLGNESIGEKTLVDSQTQIRQWRSALAADADILLYSCETGKGQVGQDFIARLAALSGADVAASTDMTGGVGTGGDWDLEVSVGSVESALAVNQQTRDRYSNTLDISIQAAGVTGQEEMQLLVAGNVVQTWTVGGDAYAGEFETFTVDLDGVSANDVRVQFTNDLFDAETGFDRNLRVDNITIDGVVYETEDPSVFSTGSWKPGEGVTPGFDESEFLQANGYFQYAETGENSGTVVRVAANGSEGGESMSLLINGDVVQSWDVTTTQTIYSYQAEGDVSLQDVQIVFDNDLYDPDNNIDRNLTVDYIELDGSRFETESPSTFSTGSWKAEDGVQPGFRQSETLNSNGYFQYGVGQNSGTQIQVAARGSEGGESMSLVVAGETVQTWAVSQNQSIFTYQADSEVSADDVRIEFTNDIYDPANDIDSNLIVDYIELDGARFETEDPSTFSTGSWLPADGIQPGFRQSETLNTNGYFQFASTTQPGDILSVSDASGQQGSVIDLDISLDVPAGSQGAVFISNLPSGALIQSGNSEVQSDGGRVLVSPDELQGLTITPASDFAGSILLNIEAIIVDSDFNETIETATLTVNVSPTDGNVFFLNASDKRDVIVAPTNSNFILDSLAGNDVVIGLEGEDQLKGSFGNDVLIGGVGADILFGDDGRDLVIGGLGGDTLEGGNGNDRVFGGGGDDTLDGGNGDDELIGGLGNDTVYAGAGTDTVVLEGARSQYVVQNVSTGYSFSGPGGTDTVFDVEFVQFVDVTVPIESINDPSFAGPPLPSIDGGTDGDDDLGGSFVIGRGGADTITGTDGEDILIGGDGNDVINGGAGDDYVQGGGGNDVILAGDGNDFIAGGGGLDEVNGGAGYDTIGYSEVGSSVTIDLTRGRVTSGSGIATLTDVESAIGSLDSDVFRFDQISDGDYYLVDGSEGFDVLDLTQFRYNQVSIEGTYIQIYLDGGGLAEIDAPNVETIDVLDASINPANNIVRFYSENNFVAGNDFANLLFGFNGNDRILGKGGNDILNGGTDDDTLLGGSGDDTLNGEDGNDVLLGGSGNDTLKGGKGNDKITDGVGNNTVNGGEGIDTLVLTGNRDDYTVELLPDGKIALTGAEGTDTVENVERFEFDTDDFSVAELLNNNPVARPDSFTGPAGVPIGGTVAANDFDPDGDTIVFQLARPPQNGTLLFSQTGSFLYTPNPGFAGNDMFLYAATDVNGGLAVVPVTIEITA